MASNNYNLVLSGGGSRGYAHIGALEALFEKGLAVNAVSATSAGALIGAFICDGFHPAEIKEMVLREEPGISFNFTGIKHGLLSFSGITAFVKKYLRSTDFAQLQKPLYVSATNLLNSEQTVLSQGPILDALLASTAIPVLFPPVTINNIPYADGGISSNLPAEPFIGEPHKIIGIHVNPFSSYDEKNSTAHIVDRTVHMVIRAGIKDNIKRCNIFIEPPALVNYHLFESKRTREIIQVGYDHVKEHVEL